MKAPKKPTKLPFEEQVALKLQDLNSKDTPKSPSHSPSSLIPGNSLKDVVEHSASETLPVLEDGESKENVLKSLIPSEPKKDWLPWFVKYLQALMKRNTDLEAVADIGLNPRTVWEAMMNHVDFAQAVDRVKIHRDWMIQSKIEKSTISRAIKGDSSDRSSATLGIFHLKARDDKYKDKRDSTPTVINITMGCQIPTTKRPTGPVFDAEVVK